MSGEDSNVAAANAVASGSEDSQARGPRAAPRARACFGSMTSLCEPTTGISQTSGCASRLVG
eukprot:6340020-Lingulodinium_polyedra.AAC.1